MNRINNLPITQNVKNVKFGSTEEIKKVETKETTPSNEDEGMSTTSKALIALAVLGAAGVGIYLLTRGKKGAGETVKETKKALEDSASKAKEDTKKAVEEAEKKAQEDAKKAAEEKVPSPETINPMPETPEVKTAREASKKELQEIYTAIYGEIKPYENKEVVTRLQALIKSEGSVESKLEKAKDIFMEEMGYDKNLIKLNTGDMSQTPFIAAFKADTGEFVFDKNWLARTSTEEIFCTLRHELDHFDKFAKLCKSLGVDKYKNLFNQDCQQTFNTDFWRKIENSDINISGFEVEKFKAAMQEQFQRDVNITGSIYTDFFVDCKYRTNPLEQSAYSIEHQLAHSLNIITFNEKELTLKAFEKADEALDKFIKKNPNFLKYKSYIFDYLYEKSSKAVLTNRGYKIDIDTAEMIKQSVEDLKAQIKILEKIPEYLSDGKTITDDELSSILQKQIKAFFDNMQTGETEEIKGLYKECFLNLEKNVLDDIQKKKIISPELELEALVRGAIVKKDICTSNFSLWEETPLQALKIDNTTTTRIFNNAKFKELHLQNGGDSTQEQYLVTLLQINAFDKIQRRINL